MRFFICFFAVFLFAPLILAPHAQEASRAPHQVGAAGEAYLDSLRFRRIDTDVAYYDPSRPAPDLKTNQKPDRPPGDEATGTGNRADSETMRWIVGLLMATVLAGLLYVVYRFGGGLSVSLGREAGNAGRERRPGPIETPAWAVRTGTLDEILRIADRRRALVELMRRALATTVSANGILMQKSWTARDALHRLPPAQAGLDRLHALVLDSERVLYGGRDVSEEDFRAHVDGCRPLLGQGTP